MKEDIKNFVVEFADNYSELFVETFIIRYYDRFKDSYLLEAIQLVCNESNKQLEKYFATKLDKIK